MVKAAKTPHPTPEEASHFLEEIAELMRLNDENPFKVRAFEKAVEIVASQKDLVERAQKKTLTEIKGIGKGIAEVLSSFLLTKDTSIQEELRSKLPPGLLQLVKIPGLGPKKAKQLIQELKITSVSELEYACRENRLLKLSGFGEKIQKKIFEGIQTQRSHEGKARLVDALKLAEEFEEMLLSQVAELKKGKLRWERTGALRRHLEVVDGLDYLLEEPSSAAKKKIQTVITEFEKKIRGGVRLRITYTSASSFIQDWVRTTGSDEHWKRLDQKAHQKKMRIQTQKFSDEKEFYQKLGLSLVAPEMRETGEELQFSKPQFEEILPEDGIRGVFHNHTNRSDGAATLEEMVKAARDRGFQYIGISDHSQSAFYAYGLKTDEIKEQEKEVQKLQEKYPEIRIFWGIESDILADGNLDYPDSVLKRFDFVIASIHSRFQMDRKQMTDRLLKAIRNPYTRFVGHLTGRLLLGRKGYEIDFDAVIKEAAKNDVAIEINANPARLDIDWRWGTLLRKYKTAVSVNPDAHAIEGLDDTSFGVTVARKALLPQGLVINSRPAKEVESWLARK